MYNRDYKSNNYNNKNLVNRDYEYDSEYKKDLNVVNEDNQENDYETVQGTDYDEQNFLDYEYEDGTKESVRVKAEGFSNDKVYSEKERDITLKMPEFERIVCKKSDREDDAISDVFMAILVIALVGSPVIVPVLSTTFESLIRFIMAILR